MSRSIEPSRRRFVTVENLGNAYCALVIFGLVGIEFYAERWLPLAILMFAPPVIYVLPLGFLIPVALWRRRFIHVALYIGCACFVVFGFMTYRFSRVSGQTAGAISVITHNIGQGEREAFAEYFPAEDPDIVILQDAARRRTVFEKRFPDHRVRGIDQFLILTRHTILRGDLVNSVRWHERFVAARFELVVDGREIAVYNVHLPTPRSSLNRVSSPRVWLEIAGLSKAPTEGFSSYRAWLDARVALAKELSDVFAQEKLPFIVGGDFNMPDHGGVYRMFARQMNDAFVKSGNGWGLTFPGSKDSRLAALLGPWLRIDYLFAGRGWKPVDCRTADDPRSQHRAVFARFEPIP